MQSLHYVAAWVVTAVFASPAWGHSPDTQLEATAGRLTYRIVATLAPAPNRIVARADIGLPPGFADADGAVALDLAGDLAPGAQPALSLDSIRSARGRRLAFAANRGTVRVSNVGTGPSTITVFYQLPLDDGTRARLGYDLYPAVGPGEYWYPDVIRPDGRRQRFRDFDVSLRFPRSYAVLTSGREIERMDRGGLTEARYSAMHVEGFALAAGPGFVVQRHDGGPTPILTFTDSAHAQTFREVAQRAAEALAWYGRTYGFVPLPQLGILQGHPRWAGGFPLPNVFMIHLGILEPDFVAWITSHELGHYYWGLHVFSAAERLDWLVLANGIWADQLYMAERHGRALADQWRARGNGDWIGDYLAAAAAGWEQRLGLPEADADTLPFDYNSLIRHGKGRPASTSRPRASGRTAFWPCSGRS